jgi:hypothetical protein
MKLLLLLGIIMILMPYNAPDFTDVPQEPSLKNIMNQEIIDGFFEGDTTGISKDYFFL